MLQNLFLSHFFLRQVKWVSRHLLSQWDWRICVACVACSLGRGCFRFLPRYAPHPVLSCQLGLVSLFISLQRKLESIFLNTQAQEIQHTDKALYIPLGNFCGSEKDIKRGTSRVQRWTWPISKNKWNVPPCGKNYNLETMTLLSSQVSGCYPVCSILLTLKLYPPECFSQSIAELLSGMWQRTVPRPSYF